MSNSIVFLACMFVGLNVMGIVFKLVKNYKDKGGCLGEKKCSLITHHLSLKIPQLPSVACLALASTF